MCALLRSVFLKRCIVCGYSVGLGAPAISRRTGFMKYRINIFSNKYTDSSGLYSLQKWAILYVVTYSTPKVADIVEKQNIHTMVARTVVFV